MHFRLTRKPVNPLLVCYLIITRNRRDMFDLLKHSRATGASQFNLRMCALKSNQMPIRKSFAYANAFLAFARS